MDAWTGLILTGLVVAVLGRLFKDRTLRRQRDKDALFGSLGFTMVGFNDYRHHIGGVPVRLMDRGFDGLEVTVFNADPSIFEANPGRMESPLGDPEFDTTVACSGDRTILLAHLSAARRSVLVDTIKEGWRLTSEGLERNIKTSRNREVVETITRGKKLLDTILAGRPRSISAGLLARVKDDPLPTIRLAALEALTTHFEANLARPALEPALKLAVEDTALDVRLFAGLRTKNPRVIASVALSIRATDEEKSKAASALFDEFANDPNTLDLCDKLTWHLAGDDGPRWPPTGVAAIVATLGAHLELSHVRDLVEAALGAEADPIQLAAIDVLERSGGLWAVPLLLPLRDDGTMGQVRTAARRAITAIQAREAGPVGALALSSGESGGLAVVVEDEGSSR